ncbi:MAG: coiled-coil domain-containing protein [Eggerthellaceae bacterium]|jgi:Skp family chaperone for outer membrane proteins
MNYKNNQSGSSRLYRIGYLSLALILAVALMVPGSLQSAIGPVDAYAVTNNTEANPSELQKEVERTAKDYDEASQKVEDLQKQIDENQAKVDELEEKLPAQQEKGAKAAVALYKMQQDSGSLVEAILSADSFQDFLSNYYYISEISQDNVTELSRLRDMKRDLQETRDSLNESKKKADDEAAKARDALKSAQEAREKAQQEARTQTESDSQTSDSDGSSEVTPPKNDGVDWSTSKSAFVDKWAPRINSYLSGSPLAGQGRTFAAAAWDYGVDPRWSPAISCVESSKGASCFRSHNAWGWGQSSWSNWHDAIYAHVAGLANGYGYTLTKAAAKKYCPPNWQHWYSRCASEMNKI